METKMNEIQMNISKKKTREKKRKKKANGKHKKVNKNRAKKSSPQRLVGSMHQALVLLLIRVKKTCAIVKNVSRIWTARLETWASTSSSLFFFFPQSHKHTNTQTHKHTQPKK